MHAVLGHELRHRQLAFDRIECYFCFKFSAVTIAFRLAHLYSSFPRDEPSLTNCPIRGDPLWDVMLDFLGKPVIVCSAALVLSLIATASSLADPRSARPTPPGQDTSSGTTNNTTPGSSQSSEPQASQASGGGSGSWTGGDGRLETSIPLKDAWSLELG